MENCFSNCSSCKHYRYDKFCESNYCWYGLDSRNFNCITIENKLYIQLHYHKLWTDTERQQFSDTRCGRTFLETLGGMYDDIYNHS